MLSFIYKIKYSEFKQDEFKKPTEKYLKTTNPPVSTKKEQQLRRASLCCSAFGLNCTNRPSVPN